MVFIILKIACEYEPFSALNWRGPPSWIDEVPRLQSIKAWLFVCFSGIKTIILLKGLNKRTVVV